MPVALFTVKATITADREREFNEWYNREHVADVLKYPGAVSARRFRAIMPEDRFQYMAVYEFQDEATLKAFLDSDHLAWLKKELEDRFGAVCERQRAAYVQIWP
jgi:antibiotic biosynthesis monooxygenase (ABM) superfamily enzyme